MRHRRFTTPTGSPKEAYKTGKTIREVAREQTPRRPQDDGEVAPAYLLRLPLTTLLAMNSLTQFRLRPPSRDYTEYVRTITS
jgi:hypothetical protein